MDRSICEGKGSWRVFILELVQKVENLLIAPKARQVLYETCFAAFMTQNGNAERGSISNKTEPFYWKLVLVRIDDKQEYTDILAEINVKGMTDVEFRIGARRDSDKKDYYWVDANNKTFGEKINADNYWASSEWAAGEPSFRWDVNSEEFVLICFNSEENRWTWNDVADKVYSPGQGKYGYIVEFD